LRWWEKYIYVNYAFFLNFIFLLPFLLFSRKKIIIQIHEYWKYLPFTPVVRFFDLLYCRIADAIVVHNIEQYGELHNLWFSNVHLLQMPIDDYVVEQKIKIPLVHLLMHGGIIRKKWFDIGIRVMELLPDSYHLTIVWWIWDATYFMELQKSIHQLQLTSKITIIAEALPDDEYEQYIKKSDIILYPYRQWTASAALADGALKFEKAFITSDIQLFRGYLGNEYDYYFNLDSLTSLRDQILSLDRNKAEEFSRTLKKQYSWNKVWKYLYTVFQQL
jgi:glycosyltransferase involved in cell wall biosynthesis